MHTSALFVLLCMCVALRSASGLDGGASKGANKSSGDGLTFRFVQGSVSQTLDLAHATKLLQRHRVSVKHTETQTYIHMQAARKTTCAT